jgi:exoribonuclease R
MKLISKHFPHIVSIGDVIQPISKEWSGVLTEIRKEQNRIVILRDDKIDESVYIPDSIGWSITN